MHSKSSQDVASRLVGLLLQPGATSIKGTSLQKLMQLVAGCSDTHHYKAGAILCLASTVATLMLYCASKNLTCMAGEACSAHQAMIPEFVVP